ncbi:MAG: AbrB/MazE/SpoVT family DNA-binding domain-containing protein [Planctomycetes bacterium]|nr:AbrB/MazE/SpoVT family DNA-binding domain-containing protein [Planctomycetota bacterium]
MSQTWTLRLEPEGENGRINLPDELLALMGLAIGDEVEIVELEGGLLITPHKPG